MPLVGIARSRRLVLVEVALAGSFASAALLFSGAALAASTPTSCPSAASIQSTAGESLTRLE